MNALDTVAADALLGDDQVRAQVFTKRCAAAVDDRCEALVNEAGNAFTAESIGIDNVGCGDAAGSNDVGGDAGKVFVGHKGSFDLRRPT